MTSTNEISALDKRLIFWGSFLALLAAGVGFVFRVMVQGEWQSEFGISGKEVGNIVGAAL